MLALVGHGVLGPESLEHLDRLFENLQPGARAREREAVGLVFALVPTGTHAENQPSAGEHVDARGFLREQTCVAVRRARHHLPELDRRRVLRECGEGRERLENVSRLAARHRLDVVVHPEMVIAQLFGEVRELFRAVPRVGRRPSAVLELPTLRRERAPLQRRRHAASPAVAPAPVALRGSW